MPEGSITAIELGHMRTDYDLEFDDECLIEEIVTQAELQTNGTISTEVRTTIYAGKCTLTPVAARRDRYDTYGESHQYQFQYRLAIPWNVTGVLTGHVVTMTSTTDPDIGTREMQVRDVHRVTDLAQRRLTLHDLQD